jgi:hypothetical protein
MKQAASKSSFNPEDGSDKFLQNIDWLSLD